MINMLMVTVLYFPRSRWGEWHREPMITFLSLPIHQKWTVFVAALTSLCVCSCTFRSEFFNCWIIAARNGNFSRRIVVFRWFSIVRSGEGSRVWKIGESVSLRYTVVAVRSFWSLRENFGSFEGNLNTGKRKLTKFVGRKIWITVIR